MLLHDSFSLPHLNRYFAVHFAFVGKVLTEVETWRSVEGETQSRLCWESTVSCCQYLSNAVSQHSMFCNLCNMYSFLTAIFLIKICLLHANIVNAF